MKTNFFIIGIACMLFMMWGCKDNDPATELIVDREVLEAPPDGGTFTITVTCNKASKATIEYDNPEETGWILMLPTVLNGNGVLELRVQPYNGTLPYRSASIIIVADSDSKTVKVTQLAADFVTVEKTAVSFSAEGGTEVVSCSSNASISALSSEPWCSATVNGNTEIEIIVQPNLGWARTAIITVNAGDAKPETITVNQAFASGLDDYLTVEITEVNFTAEAGTQLIPCSSNTEVEAVSSEPWCSVTVKDNSGIEISVQTNTTGGERTAYITVTAGEAEEVVIEVIQIEFIVVTIYDGDNQSLPVDEWLPANPGNNGHLSTTDPSQWNHQAVNPIKDGINASDVCWQFTQAYNSTGWTNPYCRLPTYSLTNLTKITVDISKPVPGNVWTQAYEWRDNAGLQLNLIANYTGSGEWQTLTFTVEDTHPWNSNPLPAVFASFHIWGHDPTIFPIAADVTYYFDNVKFYYTP